MVFPLAQAEAEALIVMEKHRTTEETGDLGLHRKVAIPLLSADGRESFFLDIYRGRIRLNQATLQNRCRFAIPLVRLDIDGPPHRNPDGEEVACPHLHVYRAGYGLKWASPLTPAFRDPGNLAMVLEDFYSYCRISRPPNVSLGLFQ